MVGPNDDLYPFWASLSLEFLARASLAKVHPSLLADPSQGGVSVLYACGLKSPTNKAQSPKSIPAHTVFERCKAAVPGFIKDHESTCLMLAEKRNSELHSGDPAFVGFETGVWLMKFYHVCKLLVAQQGQTLQALLGDAGLATAADEMIAAEDRTERAAAQKAVGLAEAAFNALAEPDREQNRLATVSQVYPQNGIQRQCPACKAAGVVIGTRIRMSDPRLEDDQIVTDITFLPTSFRCISCGLNLTKYAQLDVHNLGGQFNAKESQDANEYYGSYGDEEEHGND